MLVQLSEFKGDITDLVRQISDETGCAVWENGSGELTVDIDIAEDAQTVRSALDMLGITYVIMKDGADVRHPVAGE